MGSVDQIYRKLVKKVSKYQKPSSEFMVKIKCKNTDDLDSALHLLMYNYNCDILCTSRNTGNKYTIQITMYDSRESGVESRTLTHKNE